MKLDDDRQRLINYTAALNAFKTEGSGVPQSAVVAAWNALTDEEREALHERWGDLVGPHSA